MRVQHQWGSVLMAAVLSGLVGVTAVVAAGAQFLPWLGVREGAMRTFGSPMGNGFIDYVTLLNERDGGINGVPLVGEECETVYDIPRGVECYERLKAKGPTGTAVFPLFSTPLVYALTERASHDQIPLLAVGVGRSDAAEGRVFPYVFTASATYWSQNTAKLRFIGQRAGGMEHKALGAEGLISPITLSCRDHEGGGGVKFQQWDGKKWNALTDWIPTDQALVRPLVEAVAAKYAKEKGFTPRVCP